MKYTIIIFMILLESLALSIEVELDPMEGKGQPWQQIIQHPSGEYLGKRISDLISYDHVSVSLYTQSGISGIDLVKFGRENIPLLKVVESKEMAVDLEKPIYFFVLFKDDGIRGYVYNVGRKKFFSVIKNNKPLVFLVE